MNNFETTNGTTIKIPSSYKDITVEQLQQLEQLEDRTSLSAVKQMLHILCNDCDVDELSMEDFLTTTMLIGDFLQKQPVIRKIDKFDFEGETFKVKDVEQLKAKEYIDFDTISSSNWTENLPMLLAIITIKDGDKEPDDEEYTTLVQYRANKFKRLDADTAVAVILFFSSKFINFAKSMGIYSQAQLTPEQKVAMEQLDLLTK